MQPTVDVNEEAGDVLKSFHLVLTHLEVLLMELSHLLKCSSSIGILLYDDLIGLRCMLLRWRWRWIHVSSW